jgi:hypothetical protein
MTSTGRVSGYGLSMKVGVHFKEDSKTRKERRSKVEEAQRREIADLKAQVATLPTQMEEKFEARLRQVIPPQLWGGGLAAWNTAGGVGPIPVPSVSGSNSAQHVSPNMVTPPSYPSADPFAGLIPLAVDTNNAQPAPVPNTNTQPQPPPQPNTNVQPPPPPQPNTNVQPPPPPQPNSQPMQPRVSTLAELDALTKVTNRRLNFIHSVVLFDEYHLIMVPNMFSHRTLVAHCCLCEWRAEGCRQGYHMPTEEPP